MCNFQCKTAKTKISTSKSLILPFWLKRGLREVQESSLRNDLHTPLGHQHTLRYTHHLVFLSGEKSHQLSWGAGQEMVGGTLWSSFPSFYQYFVFLSWYFCSTVYLILSHLNCLTLVGKAHCWNQFGLQIQALLFCLLYNKSPNFSESSFIVCNKVTWRCILQGGGESQMK